MDLSKSVTDQLRSGGFVSYGELVSSEEYEEVRAHFEQALGSYGGMLSFPTPADEAFGAFVGAEVEQARLRVLWLDEQEATR
jgi:hypothetical protein